SGGGAISLGRAHRDIAARAAGRRQVAVRQRDASARVGGIPGRRRDGDSAAASGSSPHAEVGNEDGHQFGKTQGMMERLPATLAWMTAIFDPDAMGSVRRAPDGTKSEPAPTVAVGLVPMLIQQF